MKETATRAQFCSHLQQSTHYTPPPPPPLPLSPSLCTPTDAQPLGLLCRWASLGFERDAPAFTELLLYLQFLHGQQPSILITYHHSSEF